MDEKLPPSACTDCGKSHKDVNVLYETNRWYAITICPRDGLLRGTTKRGTYTGSSNATQQLNRYRDHLHGELLSITDTEYSLWADISEPREMNADKLPRIHYHGVIKFVNRNAVLEWLLTHAPRIVGNVGLLKIDTIDCPEHWLKYCKKYVPLTRQQPLHQGGAKLK